MEEITALVKPVYEAIMSGNYTLAAAMALVLAVAVLRKYGAKRWPFLASDAGGSLLALLGSFGGAVGTALMAGAAISGGLLWSAAGIAFAASGGYTLVKRLLVDPVLKPLFDKAPGWLKPVLNLALWVFGRTTAVEDAKAAGAKAVAAKPAKGIVSIVSKPKNVK